jgi:hypothetical protein
MLAGLQQSQQDANCLVCADVECQVWMVADGPVRGADQFESIVCHVHILCHLCESKGSSLFHRIASEANELNKCWNGGLEQ